MEESKNKSKKVRTEAQKNALAKGLASLKDKREQIKKEKDDKIVHVEIEVQKIEPKIEPIVEPVITPVAPIAPVVVKIKKEKKEKKETITKDDFANFVTQLTSALAPRNSKKNDDDYKEEPIKKVQMVKQPIKKSAQNLKGKELLDALFFS